MFYILEIYIYMIVINVYIVVSNCYILEIYIYMMVINVYILVYQRLHNSFILLHSRTYMLQDSI